MKIQQVLIFPLLFFIIFLFSGCSTPSTNTDLPVVSPSWNTSNGWREFYANDTNYYGYSYSETINATDTLAPPKVEIKKIAGAASYGFGVVFAIQPDGSYYRFLIDTKGYYSVQEKNASGNFSTIKDWTSNSAILSGYDTINTVNITYNPNYDPGDGSGPYSDYEISVNSSLVFGFYNTPGAMLLGGKSGFTASIGSESSEDFPNTPVDVRFKMLTPVTFP